MLQRGYDAGVSGANLAETTLNTSNVAPNTFRIVFTLPVDDVIYAQPLYVPNVAIPLQGIHNVVYVATMSDTLYAFDADAGGAPLWELIEILLRLDQLKIIEYRPPHRVRKLTARNFAWRKDGPVHGFFVRRFVPEFFESAFDGVGEAFRFVGGTLSPGSLSQFKASLERLAVEFEELARGDARLPLAKRDGCSAILAVRSWEFSEFTRLRRVGSSRGARISHP